MVKWAFKAICDCVLESHKNAVFWLWEGCNLEKVLGANPQTSNFTHITHNQTHLWNLCQLKRPGPQFSSFHSLFWLRNFKTLAKTTLRFLVCLYQLCIYINVYFWSIFEISTTWQWKCCFVDHCVKTKIQHVNPLSRGTMGGPLVLLHSVLHESRYKMRLHQNFQKCWGAISPSAKEI